MTNAFLTFSLILSILLYEINVVCLLWKWDSHKMVEFILISLDKRVDVIKSVVSTAFILVFAIKIAYT